MDELGVLVAFEAEDDDGYRIMQLHPADTGGSFLEIEGKQVFRDAAAVDRFEWSVTAGADASTAAVLRTADTAVLETLGAELAGPRV